MDRPPWRSRLRYSTSDRFPFQRLTPRYVQRPKLPADVFSTEHNHPELLSIVHASRVCRSDAGIGNFGDKKESSLFLSGSTSHLLPPGCEIGIEGTVSFSIFFSFFQRRSSRVFAHPHISFVFWLIVFYVFIRGRRLFFLSFPLYSPSLDPLRLRPWSVFHTCW